MVSIVIKGKRFAAGVFFLLVLLGGLSIGEYKILKARLADDKIGIAHNQAKTEIDKLLQGEVPTSMIVEESYQPKKNTKVEFFVDYRLERDRTRSQQIELLREMVNNANSSEEIRKEAQKRLLAITSSLEKEMEIENLIRAKDYKDAVVFIQGDTVTIIIQAKDLTQEDIQKVSSLVVKSTGTKLEDVIIISKE